MRWLLGLWLLGLALSGLAQSDPFPRIGAAYWLETNGSVMWRHQADQRLPPASLTKMMTALLVLEHSAQTPDAVVKVSPAAARETGSRMALKAGEQFTVADLLAATLIASANDACRALAEHLAGDQARFVQRMNQRARQLGMHHTRFANACGHDAPGHYSSARDLARLAHALMQHPQALSLASQREHSIRTVDGRRSFSLKTTNALLGRYPGAIGLKTGRTAQAGHCLVALAQRGDTQVLLVLLKGSDRWWDTVDVLDLAFARAAH
ncbi:D-alanyl-D-alanine carboxypeptidase family protein [Rhodoferax sp.]|uniref:D-alanyl-D-alanine carboxypeptidase family protein n=1 Tax=Rhodoferax sp. TaxID=50421 RepID=UPI00262517DD|nr:D-alanyl-D-alanine carboxypeptidase family protein [Rhodoferax sp.]MDD2925719.1 D-alanyl-D-alanine carboxypeptidase [Rhodoferax sp.]